MFPSSTSVAVEEGHLCKKPKSKGDPFKPVVSIVIKGYLVFPWDDSMHLIYLFFHIRLFCRGPVLNSSQQKENDPYCE